MMMAKEILHEEAKKPMSMHPKKFALWLFLVSVVMIFASLTSYVIVKRAEGNWLEFELPVMFWISTFIILASSGTMHWAYLSAKKDNLQGLKIAILLTTVLGIAFMIGQFYGWGELINNKVFLGGKASNPAGSIVYIISGLHWVHIMGGVIYLIVVTVNSFGFKIHSKSLVQIEMCAIYWHFLDALWIYLFAFLLLNR